VAPVFVEVRPHGWIDRIASACPGIVVPVPDGCKKLRSVKIHEHQATCFDIQSDITVLANRQRGPVLGAARLAEGALKFKRPHAAARGCAKNCGAGRFYRDGLLKPGCGLPKSHARAGPL
jgi:hypothetical protein